MSMSMRVTPVVLYGAIIRADYAYLCADECDHEVEEDDEGEHPPHRHHHVLIDGGRAGVPVRRAWKVGIGRGRSAKGVEGRQRA